MVGLFGNIEWCGGAGKDCGVGYEFGAPSLREATASTRRDDLQAFSIELRDVLDRLELADHFSAGPGTESAPGVCGNILTDVSDRPVHHQYMDDSGVITA